MTWIAEQKVIWVFPSGERRPGRIAVGMPEFEPGDSSTARCAYALEGLVPAHGPMLGEGTLQALHSALSVIGFWLHEHFARGVRVLIPDEADEGPEDLEESTAGLISMLGTLVRSRGDDRGPADPKGEIAGLEAKLVEMRRPPAG